MEGIPLPDSWFSVPISEVCDIVRGVTFKKADSISEPKQGYLPVLRANGIQDGRILLEDLVYVPEEMIAERQLIKKGDVVIAMSSGSKALVGKAARSVQDLPVGFGAFCGVLRPSDKLDSNYFGHFFQSKDYRNSVSALSAGVNINNLKPAHFKEIQLPVAPLPEQTRIANKLDELLAQVDTIKARVDAIPNILKRFRQSVLAAAVSGRLTEEWRGGDASPVPAEYDSWAWGEVPNGWSIYLYPQVVESRLGKMLDKSKNTGKATSYLGNINVRWFGFNLAELQEILVSDSEIQELSVQPGDVLICEGGEPGRCAIWQENTNEAIVFQKALHRARVSDALLPEWLVINLKNDADRNILNQLFTGTTIKHLTGKALKKYPLRIPPIQEQREIVARVNSLMSFADQIESRIIDGQNAVDSMSQSILAKAFRGELVPQNPNDEPASVLLERLQCP